MHADGGCRRAGRARSGRDREPRPARTRHGAEATKRNIAAARIGDPLVVAGTVRGEDCAPLAGATINVWQTNGDGRYGPVVGGRDRCCYLAGTVLTGEDGRYALDTVMPRGYDGGPAHIHLRAGHPDAEGVVTELLFGSETNPQAVTVEARDGTAELDIVLRGS
jgi:protocatechuate 3,4-dioxygenase beta subunit